MPPRAPTAYFLFTAEVRADVHKELLATSSDGKVSVATVSKAIGEKWRHMSDEEKQRYKDLAAQKAAELNGVYICVYSIYDIQFEYHLIDYE